MENLGIGQALLLLLLFILTPLLNFLLQRFRKRRNHHIPQEKPVDQMLHRGQTTPTPRPTPRAAGDRVHGSPARTVTPLANDHVTKTSPLGTKSDVRRAIVIMTLLGTCRAFDPPN